MSTLFIRWLVAIGFSASTAAMHATAAPVSDSDAQQIHGVIVAQLAAFAEDDADGALETATPSVREAIRSSGSFLAMVRGTYPMVYRPASVTFQKPEENEGNVMQLVEITDSNAKTWLALFALERQSDASWRISGCAVTENRWQPI